MRFVGRTIVITGAGGGIGRATAVAFALEGAHLLLSDVSQAGLDATAQAAREAGAIVDVHIGDLTQAAAVAELVGTALKTLGHIDGFFVNAGIQGAFAPVHTYPEAEFDQVMAINTRSVFLCLHHALPSMIARQAGAIVVTCSVAALGGMANLAGYVASKHAALGLVRSAALDVAAHGVRVNAICPGATDTPMLAEVVAKAAPDARATMVARFAASSPMGRVAAPQEIADMVLFLCSDQAQYITGAQFTVDGGLSARLGGATKA